jgi:hypothetical protein
MLLLLPAACPLCASPITIHTKCFLFSPRWERERERGRKAIIVFSAITKMAAATSRRALNVTTLALRERERKRAIEVVLVIAAVVAAVFSPFLFFCV